MFEKTIDLFNKNFEELKDKEQECYKKAKQYFIENFDNLIQNFFSKSPNIFVIEWVQMIPSYNDGDPCIFSVGDLEFLSKKFLTEKEQLEYIKDNYFPSQDLNYVYSTMTKEKIEAIGISEIEFNNLLKLKTLFNNRGNYEYFKAMFGYNTKITYFYNGQKCISEYYD